MNNRIKRKRKIAGLKQVDAVFTDVFRIINKVDKTLQVRIVYIVNYFQVVYRFFYDVSISKSRNCRRSKYRFFCPAAVAAERLPAGRFS